MTFQKHQNYWISKGCGRRYFTRQTLIDAISFLITKCYFTIGNLVFNQVIDISIGIDQTPYWANLSLYFFESKYVQQLIFKRSPFAFKFHELSRFIGILCTINDDGLFSSSYKYIYLGVDILVWRGKLTIII